MRSKEDAHDYRYFPDPDLLPLEVSDEFINDLKNDIPELPDDKKKRFIDEFKLSPYEATILVSDIDTAKYFESLLKLLMWMYRPPLMQIPNPRIY